MTTHTFLGRTFAYGGIMDNTSVSILVGYNHAHLKLLSCKYRPPCALLCAQYQLQVLLYKTLFMIDSGKI